jgi:hypothetical protein
VEAAEDLAAEEAVDVVLPAREKTRSSATPTRTAADAPMAFTLPVARMPRWAAYSCSTTVRAAPVSRMKVEGGC